MNPDVTRGPPFQPSGTRNTIFSDLAGFLAFRCKRLYTTFYHAQYSGKFALVLLFPGLLSLIRYRAETQFAYYLIVTDESIVPKPRLPKWLLNRSNKLDKSFEWKNGMKFYCKDDMTVSDLKNKVYNGAQNVPADAVVGCKGRMFADSDNLALAVRSFCKRDPRLLVWRESWRDGAKEEYKILTER